MPYFLSLPLEGRRIGVVSTGLLNPSTRLSFSPFLLLESFLRRFFATLKQIQNKNLAKTWNASLTGFWRSWSSGEHVRPHSNMCWVWKPSIPLMCCHTHCPCQCSFIAYHMSHTIIHNILTKQKHLTKLLENTKLQVSYMTHKSNIFLQVPWRGKIQLYLQSYSWSFLNAHLQWVFIIIVCSFEIGTNDYYDKNYAIKLQ